MCQLSPLKFCLQLVYTQYYVPLSLLTGVTFLGHTFFAVKIVEDMGFIYVVDALKPSYYAKFEDKVEFVAHAMWKYLEAALRLKHRTKNSTSETSTTFKHHTLLLLA